jgi:hypothetical protein
MIALGGGSAPTTTIGDGVRTDLLVGVWEVGCCRYSTIVLACVACLLFDVVLMQHQAPGLRHGHSPSYSVSVTELFVCCLAGMLCHVPSVYIPCCCTPVLQLAMNMLL